MQARISLHRNNKAEKAQQQKPEVNAGKPSPEQKAKGKDSQPQQKEKKVDVTSPVEEPQRQPVQEKQNVARLPKREVQPVAPEPKVEREKELGHVEVRERKSQRLGSLSRLRRKQTRKTSTRKISCRLVLRLRKHSRCSRT